MIWNDSAPMELLTHMPSKLTNKNLAAIQEVIDKDKYVCSMAYQRDLCGAYAPFCAFCDKTQKYPCAVAYVKMKNLTGMQLEIAAADDETEPEDFIEPQNTEPSGEEQGNLFEESPEEAVEPAFEETTVEEPAETLGEPVAEEVADAVLPAAVAETVVETVVDETEPTTEAEPVAEAPDEPVQLEITEDMQIEPEPRRIRIAVARRKH